MSAGGRWSQGQLVLLALLFAGVLTGAVAERSDRLAEARSALRKPYAHRGDFPGDKTLRLLVEQGILHPFPLNRAVASQRPFIHARRTDARSEYGPMHLFGVPATAPSLYPSATNLPPDALTARVPVISVAINPGDHQSILSSPSRRGRQTERAVFVSYLEPGELPVSFSAGLRLHGGRSRRGSAKKSYRLYLRPEHGTASLPTGLFFSRNDPPDPPALSRLVLHNDSRFDNFDRDWRLVNPMAYEIARRVGAQTPRTRPVRFYLNGEAQGTYVLTEYLDATYFESRLGHPDFTMSRTKHDPGGSRLETGDDEAYADFIHLSRHTAEASLEEIAAAVDIDNLFKWFASVLICGTDDFLQGPMVLDQSEPGAKWFWVNWDMDHSFMSAGSRTLEEPWTFNLLREVGRIDKPRARLLKRLFRDEKQRAEFLRLYSESMNHRVTPPFLEELVDRYEALAEDLGIEERSYFEHLRRFLDHRPERVRWQLNARLAAGEVRRAQVTVPPGRSLEIDGYAWPADYAGRYFDGQRVRVAVAADDRANFSHWLVNGEEVGQEGDTLQWVLHADTRIEPVFR